MTRKINVRKDKQMASQRPKDDGIKLPLISDWTKMIIAIIVQSVTVGFYIASTKSDLEHLSEDFKERRHVIDLQLSEVRNQINELNIIRPELKSMVGADERAMNRLIALEKAMSEEDTKIYVLKDKLKDLENEIANLKNFSVLKETPKAKR